MDGGSEELMAHSLARRRRSQAKVKPTSCCGFPFPRPRFEALQGSTFGRLIGLNPNGMTLASVLRLTTQRDPVRVRTTRPVSGERRLSVGRTK